MRSILKIFLTTTILTSLLFSQVAPPIPPGISKLDYYNKYLAPARGLKPLTLYKKAALVDRKRSVLNVGNLVLRFSNAAILGYDRWGLNHQFPAGSDMTYYWNMAPIIGGVRKLPDGTLKKSVACGTWGAARLYEGEFEPLLGYDSGQNIPDENIGIAFSDKPESWPDIWPANPYTDPVTGESFYIERPLDQDLPDGSGLRFPGFLDGKVVAIREAYLVVTDNDPGEGSGNRAEQGPLNIRLDMWAIQYEDELNQDFIIFKMICTNIGPDTLFDVYLGIHGDPDAPEQGGAEWTDDFALFFHDEHPEYMEAQLGYVDSLLFNTLIVYDADDYSEGFLDSKVGWIGFKVLETPINPNTGEEFGITTIDFFPYSDAPQGDLAEYAQLTLGIEAPNNINPHPTDQLGGFPYSYGPDITVVVASGPFDLHPGESQLMSFASILGVNKTDILNNCKLSQLLHNADYRAAQPPPEPIVNAVEGDQEVTLYWDSYPSEYGIDPLTKSTDKFQGYRIYKSTDRGRTWGEPITDINGVVVGYVPAAIYDKEDDIEGINPMNLYLDQGSNSGLKYSFIDTDVINGFEYWYAICAFDAQDGVIPPMENSRKKTAKLGDPFNDNTVAIVPRAKIAAWKSHNIDIEHTGYATAQVDIQVYNPDALKNNTYVITFDDATYDNFVFSVYDSLVDSNIIDSCNLLHGEDWIQSFDGMRLSITDVSSMKWDPSNTYWSTTIPADYQYISRLIRGSKPVAANYQVRFTSEGDTSLMRQIFVPFEIWNTRSNNKIDFVIGISSTDSTDEMRNSWTSGDIIVFVDEYPWDSWSLTMTSPTKIDTETVTVGDSTYLDSFTVDIGIPPNEGDTLFIAISIPLESSDRYYIRTTASGINKDALKKDIKKVKVVPNPYKITSVYETSLEVKQVQFTHLPEHCDIRIFNLSGDFITKLEHHYGSIEPWDLRTYNDQEISFGIYIFVIDAYANLNSKKFTAQQIGKFAVIK
ncbi:MAG: hypothetical protein KAT54_04090 [Candidatus Marinimicrobia bacterium]|nr:hypothetical protein [Candidatus Neomarinimicrobiota bacterium]